MKRTLRYVKLAAAGLVAVALLAVSSCEDRRMRIHQAPLYGPGSPLAQQSELVPGRGATVPASVFDVSPAELAEGRRLYGWYNCAGCHFNGGGGIGPPLMDNEWIYGSEPRNIADSIINGRPQGMPAYGDKIPAAHIGPVVAYVRSLSGLGQNAPATPTPVTKEAKKDAKEEMDLKSEEQRQRP